MMAAATGQRLRPRCAIPPDSQVARAFCKSAAKSGLVAREQRKLAASSVQTLPGTSDTGRIKEGNHDNPSDRT